MRKANSSGSGRKNGRGKSRSSLVNVDGLGGEKVVQLICGDAVVRSASTAFKKGVDGAPQLSGSALFGLQLEVTERVFLLVCQLLV